MNPKIVASSPGKTILHGEHAVVLGKSAIAVSVELRTTVTVELIGEPNENVVMIAENFGKTFDWKSNELSELNFVTRDVQNRIPIYNENEVTKLDRFLQNRTSQDYASDTAKCFLFIYLNACNMFNNSKPIALTTRILSELPIGSGMGSSASISVSLVAALLKAFDVTDLSKELVCNWSYECEKIFHGKPSGIDNSICTYGGVILFKEKKIIDRLDSLLGIELLLVHTNHSRNTKKLIEKTSSRRKMFPNIMEKIIESIDLISLAQWQNFKNDKNYDEIKTLITMNQNLLDSMGAGHYSINKILNIADTFDLAGKLTGAGGGGTVFILLKPDDGNGELSALIDKLKSEGFAQSWKLDLGVSGLSLEIIEENRKHIF